MGPRLFDAVSGGLRRRGVSSALSARFAIDPRGLAGMRIALGLIVLLDLSLRSQDLVAHYTDVGVLPRAVLRTQFGGLAPLAFAHGMAGDLLGQAVLFGLTALAALALVGGYHTRLATLVTFGLLVSLHARNPVLLNAGDSLLRRLLLWGLFLPLAGRWSIDAIRTEGRRTAVTGLASTALLVQVVIVYVVNAVLKLRGDAWLDGTAIRLVFELDQLTIGLGNLLAGYPRLLTALGWLWLALLVASPLLLALRGWPRATLAGLFAAMHLGMLLTMRLGVFPLVSMAALLPFVPSVAWDRLVGVAGPRPAGMAAWLERLGRRLPDRPRWSIPPALSRLASEGVPVVVALMLVFVLVWNAAGLGLVRAPDEIRAVADPTERRWDMFAPEPRRNDGWFVVPGRLESGERIDAFHGGPVSWERPAELARTFPSHRWFVYLIELPHPRSGPLRAAFAQYLCRDWNAAHDTELQRVTIVYVLEPASLEGSPEPRRVRLGRYPCTAG